MASPAFRCCFLLCALLVSACGGAALPEPSEGADCFPAAARAQIAADAEADRPGTAAEPTQAVIYVDRSRSMLGYIRPQTETVKPFQNLVGTMPAMLSNMGASASYRAFGLQVSPRPIENGAEVMARRDFFDCTNCDNQDTELKAVFDAVAADRRQMAIVISDMWLSSQRAETSALAQLAAPLGEILRSGRSIAIYGISAPFTGRITDMPAGAPSFDFAGEHPLYLIAVGTDAQLAGLHRSLEEAPSPDVREAMRTGAMHRSLFTMTPGSQASPPAAPFGDADTDLFRRVDVMELPRGVAVQQFLFDQAAAGELDGPAGPVLRWPGPSAADFAPGSVWQGAERRRLTIWQLDGEACSADAWQDGPQPREDVLARLWAPAPGGFAFALDPAALEEELTEAGTYLLVGELYRPRVAPQANAWMDAWSFDERTPAPGRVLANGRPFYPTAYIREFGRHLESVLQRQVENSAEAQGRAVSGFAVVVKVE